MTPDISVLILTLNEERNLEACLRAVSWSDDVVVFDSFSTDRTVEIAKDCGARVIQRHFDNERSHRAASLQVPFKHSWVFNPDADEIATEELSLEMLSAVATSGRDAAAFRMRRKDMFMGLWIRHSSLYPTWFARLFRPDKIRFERTINLNCIVDGPELRLEQHLLHYSFNKGLDEWLTKHNKYSRAEAFESLQSLKNSPLNWHNVILGDPLQRRRALKEVSFRVPFRPLARFLYMYVARKGFMDGIPGFHFCCLVSFYEYMICLKMRELQGNVTEPAKLTHVST